MKTLHYTTRIQAPREKVWKTMLEDKTYRIWTEAFSPGSHFVGDWSQGSKIHFLASDESGKLGGMVSRIKESRPPEFVSIEHLGVVQDGKEVTTGDAVQGWAGAMENYTFKDAGEGVTELSVDVDTEESHLEAFGDMWPKALAKLKELAEKE